MIIWFEPLFIQNSLIYKKCQIHLAAQRGIITVIRKDYVRRDDSQIIYKRQKKKLNRVAISKALVILGIALVVILIGCFYFISRDKPKRIKLLMTQNIHTDYLLLSKPQERWYYVKELKNRPTDVLTSSESFYDNNPKMQIPLTYEQHKLLKQIQFDMRYTGTQLPIVLDTTTPNIQADRKEMMKNLQKVNGYKALLFVKFTRPISFDYSSH